MKIKVIKPYPDREQDRIVFRGEELNVTRERGERLISLGYAREAKEAPLFNGEKSNKSSQSCESKQGGQDGAKKK